MGSSVGCSKSTLKDLCFSRVLAMELVSLFPGNIENVLVQCNFSVPLQ